MKAYIAASLIAMCIAAMFVVGVVTTILGFADGKVDSLLSGVLLVLVSLLLASPGMAMFKEWWLERWGPFWNPPATIPESGRLKYCGDCGAAYIEWRSQQGFSQLTGKPAYRNIMACPDWDANTRTSAAPDFMLVTGAGVAGATPPTYKNWNPYNCGHRATSPYLPIKPEPEPETPAPPPGSAWEESLKKQGAYDAHS